MIQAFTDKYLVNDKLKEVPYIHSKARVLAYVHLFAFSLGIFFYLTSFFITNGDTIPLIWGSALIFLLMVYFSKKGNLVISGNFLAGIVFCVLFSTVDSTGGIYSDNLLWMLLAPLIALLFASRASGIFWTLALSSATVYLYFEEIKNVENGREFSLLFETEYYLFSYIALFIAIVCIVHIFEKGREEIIAILVGKNKELIENRVKLRTQRDQLIQQKKELEILSQELKNSNADLDSFAQAASHDMKQPLRMIKSYIKLISRDENIKLKGSTLEYMNYVIDGADRLEHLIKDLLSLSQVGKESNNHTEVSLNDVIIIVKNNLSEVIKETNAVVHVENLPDIYASRSLIIQLFQNLISNGIKFQRGGTLPVISIKAEIKETDVIVEVKDNGIGISEEYQEKVFNIFERLHTQAEYDGSGIGLHTCKKIMDSMGKKMWLTSKEGEGTSFYLVLPLLRLNQMDNKSISAESYSSKMKMK
jgi:signal transduction histidine kinase